MANREVGQIWVSQSRKQLGVHIQGDRYMPSFPLFPAQPGYEPTVGDPVTLTVSSGSSVIRLVNTLVDRRILGIVSRQDPTGMWEVIFISFATIPLSAFSSSEFQNPQDLLNRIVYVAPIQGTIRYTTDKAKASFGGRSIIEIGMVTRVNGSTVEVNIDLGGDSQGPVGTGQVEYISGVSLPSRVGKNPYVVAISSEGSVEKFRCRLEIRSHQGDTYQQLNHYSSPEEATYFQLSGPLEGSVSRYFYPRISQTVSGSPLSGVTYHSLDWNITDNRWVRSVKLWNALKTNCVGNYDRFVLVVQAKPGTGDQFYGPGVSSSRIEFSSAISDPVLGTFGYISAQTNDTVQGTLEDLVSNPGVPLEVFVEFLGPDGGVLSAEVSSDAHFVMSHYTQGLSVAAGRLMLADKRMARTSNVVGVLISKNPCSIGDPVLVQKIGTLSGFHGLVPGKKVWLSMVGEITQDETSINLGEYMVYLGVARDETTVDLNIAPAVKKILDRDEVPIGTKMVVEGVVHGTGIQFYHRDPFFLHCNGATVLRNDPNFGQLFAPFLDVVAGVNATSYVLPNEPKTVIKYLNADLNATGHPVTSLRFVTGWERIDQVFSAQGSFSSWQIDHPLTAPLSNLVVQVFVNQVPTDTGARLLNQGFTFSSDGNQVYGFLFEEDHIGRIRMVFRDNLGYVRDSNGTMVPIPSSWYLKVVIYEPKLISTFVDATAESKLAYLWDRESHYTSPASTVRDGYMTAQEFRNVRTLLQALNLDEQGNPLPGGVTSISID